MEISTLAAKLALDFEAVKGIEARAAGAELQELNNKVKTKATTTKKNVEKTTYYPPEFFGNTGDIDEGFDGIEPTPEDIKTAKQVYATLINFENIDEAKNYIDSNINNWNKSVIQLVIKQIKKQKSIANKKVNDRDYAIRKHNGMHGENYQINANADDLLIRYKIDAEFYEGIASKLRAFLEKQAHEQKLADMNAQLENARAQGVVTNYKEIPANSKLDTIIKKLQITFKEDEKGRIKLFVNGQDANFKIFNPKYDKSYELMTGENIALIIEIMGKTGKKYFAKFYLDNDKVTRISASKIENLGQPKSFDLSPKQEDSYTKH
jgi:hypothetical protein